MADVFSDPSGMFGGFGDFGGAIGGGQDMLTTATSFATSQSAESMIGWLAILFAVMTAAFYAQLLFNGIATRNVKRR